MSVIDDYLEILDVPAKQCLEHMYEVVREMVPDATEELSYSMPAFKYKGKGLIAIMVNKGFLSLYPFCGLDRLGLDVAGFKTTTGSLHFTLDKPVPDELLRRIIAARVSLITA